MSKILILGTDTHVGKTIFSAGLTLSLKAHYWKPIQAGINPVTDSESLRALGVPNAAIHKEKWLLKTPASPHYAAKIDQVNITSESLSAIPNYQRYLVIESAGGVLVPINQHELTIDVYQKWKIPAILCTRTTLGTINHTLLTIEALRSRNIPILGIVFIGDENQSTQSIITSYANLPSIGRLPFIENLNRDTLLKTFNHAIQLNQIVEYLNHAK